jgi:hypothetical protein
MEERIETQTGNGGRPLFARVGPGSAGLMAAPTRLLWLVVMAIVAATILFLAAFGGGGGT